MAKIILKDGEISSSADINVSARLVGSDAVFSSLGTNTHLVLENGIYNTLQDAINSSSTGDTILVGPRSAGWGDIELPASKQLSILGLSTPKTPFNVKIGSISFEPTVGTYATQNEIHIANFFINGDFSSTPGIHVGGSAPSRLKIEGCYIYNNSSAGGNTVLVDSTATGTSLYIENSIINGSSATAGAAVKATTSYLVVRNCDVFASKNAFHLAGNTTVELGTTKIVTSNTDSTILIDAGNLSANSIYVENGTADGSGLKLSSMYSFAAIDNSIFNVATGTGYVIWGSGVFAPGNNSYSNIPGVLARNVKIQNTITTIPISTTLTAAS